MINKLLFDARAITPKPCGVRNVVENYLAEFSNEQKIYALINHNSPVIDNKNITYIRLHKSFSRFNIFFDAPLISYFVIRYKIKIFISLHSFIPIFSVLPKKTFFICHDIFSAVDKTFFNKRGYLSSLANLYMLMITELSFLRSAKIFTPSMAISKTFKKLKFYKKNKVIVINNGIRSKIFKKLSKLENQFLYIGNYRRYKGCDLMLEAWNKSKSIKLENANLKIITNEILKPFNYSEGFFKKNRIDIKHRVNDEELLKHRDNSQFFIIPSREEGFGIPLLEAIQAKGIIICSNIDIFKDIINKVNYKKVIFFENDNSLSLIEKLEEALQKKNYFESINVEGSLLNLEKFYSWKSSYKILLDQIL